jgi:hypothetical protein
VKPDPRHTCQVCGEQIPIDAGLGPVCALRGALHEGHETVEVNIDPTPSSSPLRFDHYQILTREDGTPLEPGRGERDPEKSDSLQNTKGIPPCRRSINNQPLALEIKRFKTGCYLGVKTAPVRPHNCGPRRDVERCGREPADDQIRFGRSKMVSARPCTQLGLNRETTTRPLILRELVGVTTVLTAGQFNRQ